LLPQIEHGLRFSLPDKIAAFAIMRARYFSGQRFR